LTTTNKTKTNNKNENKKKKISLPYSGVAGDTRTKGMITNLVDLYPAVDGEQAKHRIFYDTVKDTEHDVEYGYAFEIIAIPVRRELLSESSTCFATKFYGAINYSVSPKGNTFEGSYRWRKEDKKDSWRSDNEAHDIQGILIQYSFSFSREYNSQKTKLPCVIYGNLISGKLNYIGQSKTEVDTTPFANTIIEAVAAIAKDIQTFRAAEIRTPDYHAGSSSSYYSYYNRIDKSSKAPKIERIGMFDIVYEKIRERIELVKNGGEWTVEMHTQMSLWYNSLSLINKNVEAGKLKKPKNRNNFIDSISRVCDHYGVRREEVGIVAGAWANLFYNSHWSAVNFEDIGMLARNGTDIIFIEKADIVQSLGPYASKYGVALVNSKGQLSDYAKQLSTAAKKGGAHIAIFTDYDIPGLHIASKLEGALWLGVDEPMLEHFGISHQDAEWVIPYDPSKGLGDGVIKRDIESDERFAGGWRRQHGRIDIEWLKQKKFPGGSTEAGNKVEIDAVLAKAGSAKLWDYLMKAMSEKYRKRDYTRVIHNYRDAPMPSAIGFTIPSIVWKLQTHMRSRADFITREARDKIRSRLKEYEGFLVVQDKEGEIRQELSSIVNSDQQIKDVSGALSEIARSVEEEITETVKSRMKKLDEEKDYGIMDSLSL
jgi:hypothetical protein